MTTDEFERYQKLHTVIHKLYHWTIHASMSNIAPITDGDNLPSDLKEEIHKKMLEMAEKHLKKLENEFEHL